jgi:N-acetylmuramoyl-L-alanine amidase
VHRLRVGLSFSFGVVLCLQLGCADLLARDRAAAREAYRKAVEYHGWLRELPKEQRTPAQYRQAIRLYRLVVDHDPTYGACDDAIYAIAAVYDELADRFGRESDRNRAVYYYEFVAREYPLTKSRDAALTRARELRAGPSPEPERQPVAARPESPAETRRDLATLSEVRYWSNEDYTRVVLQLDREVAFERVVLSDPDRIYFDLPQTRVDPRLIDRTYEVNGLFIKRIRLAENRPGLIRVVLDFDRVDQHTVFALYDPFRIVVDTRGDSPTARAASPLRETAPPADPPPPDPPPSAVVAEAPGPVEPEPDRTDEVPTASPTIQGNWTLTRTLGLKVGRVVIDPGHGGKDTGTVGPTGLREKDLVLNVALYLKELLETRLGIDVILTRSDDRFIPLEERTAIANQKGADLFVSIHANASRNRRAAGVETYVLDFATTPAEVEVASRENATAQKNIRELEDLLRKIALGDFNQESRDLAQTVQRELVAGISGGRPGHQDRGVKQAPFIVLIGSNMPSILTEIGFISNPEEERFFKMEEAQRQAAEALFRGIEGYFRSLGTLPAVQHTATAAGR